MHRSTTSDFAKLGQLTQVREITAMSELAKNHAKCREVEEEIVNLKSRSPTNGSIEETVAFSKWAVWRERELSLRFARLAVLMSERSEIARACGKAIATNAVVDTLLSDAKSADQAALEKQRLSATNGGLHFLPNNVRDQDVRNFGPDNIMRGLK